MNRYFVTALFALLLNGQATAQEHQYDRIYNLLQEGDSLNNTDQLQKALGKYLEAQTALERFQKGNADWNVPVVKFRIRYLATKIADLSAKVPAAAPVQAPVRAASPAAPRQSNTPQIQQSS